MQAPAPRACQHFWQIQAQHSTIIALARLRYKCEEFVLCAVEPYHFFAIDLDSHPELPVKPMFGDFPLREVLHHPTQHVCGYQAVL